MVLLLLTSAAAANTTLLFDPGADRKMICEAVMRLDQFPNSWLMSRCSATSLYRLSLLPADLAYFPVASLVDCLPPALALQEQ